MGLLQFGFMVVAGWKLVGKLFGADWEQTHPEHISGYPDPRGWMDICTITDGYPMVSAPRGVHVILSISRNA